MKTIFKQTLLATAVTLAAMPVLAAYNDAGTDFSKAQTQSWTWTPGLEPLNTANQILCFINNLEAGDMVNKGIYAALVDMNACQAGQSNGSSKGPNNMFAIVHSTRANSSSPEEVDVWVPNMAQGSGSSAQIHAHAEITASPTATNPSGEFKMTYRMYPITNGTVGSTPIEKGQLKSLPNSNGKVNLSFYSNGTDQGHNFVSAVSVVKTPDGSSGAAITQGMNYQNFTTEYHKMTWDDGTALGMVKIEKPDLSQVCLNKNDITENVYQYGLYDASTGAAVKINGGFPFQFTRQDGSTANGYLGYWGAWMDDDTNATFPMTVKKIDYTTQPPTKTDITLHQSAGRLVKITSESKTPSSMASVRFDYWDNSNGNQYQVKYLTSAPANTTGYGSAGFYEVATVTQSQNGQPTVTPLSNITLVTPSFGDTVYLDAQQLGGSVSVHYNTTPTPPVPDNVILQKRVTVTPDKAAGIPGALYCSYNCPKGNLTSTDLNSTPSTVWQDTSGGPVTYTFDATAMVLKDSNGNPVVWPSSATAGGQFEDGIHSGALMGSSSANMTNTTTWYTWDTGPDEWNKTTWATGASGNVITIDPPLSLSFTFNQADDRNASSSTNGSTYYGNPFLLDYSGDGQLNGLPYEMVNNHYVPSLTLADGTQLTNANDSTKVYVVKALQEEKDPNGGSNCASLTLPTNGSGGVQLPTSVPAADLDAIQPMPSNYPQEPSVINGVIQ